MLAVAPIPHQGVNALILDTIINTLRIVTGPPLRGDRLLPPSQASDFTPGSRSRTNFWLFEGRNLISQVERTIVFGFWLERSWRLGFLLLGLSLRSVSVLNRSEY